MDYRWYKKELESMRDLTKGVMPLVRLCDNEEQVKAYKEASKGMRNIKNLEFKVDNNSIQSEKLDLEEKSQSSKENINIIKSPMVGTVYLSPSPEDPTFIQVGKKLKKGDTILIIEAMKTMNQIPSTIEGTVKEILVNNESPVEFDTPLVIIEP